MRFTGQRLEFCVACGDKLPPGSRIDRKYCRAACIERAYYERHPDKKRVPGSRRLPARDGRPGANQSSGAPSNQPDRHPTQDDIRPPSAAEPARSATPEPPPGAAWRQP